MKTFRVGVVLLLLSSGLAHADRVADLRKDITLLKMQRAKVLSEIRLLSRECPACRGQGRTVEVEAREKMHRLEAQEIFLRYEIVLDEAELNGGVRARKRVLERQCPSCENAAMRSPEVTRLLRELLMSAEGVGQIAAATGHNDKSSNDLGPPGVRAVPISSALAAPAF